MFQSSADLNLLKFVGESPASCLPFCSTDLHPLCKCSWDSFWALWGLLWNLTLKLFSVSSLAPPSCSTDLRAVCESPRAQNPLVGALQPPPDQPTNNQRSQIQKDKSPKPIFGGFFKDDLKFPFQQQIHALVEEEKEKDFHCFVNCQKIIFIHNV